MTNSDDRWSHLEILECQRYSAEWSSWPESIVPTLAEQSPNSRAAFPVECVGVGTR